MLGCLLMTGLPGMAGRAQAADFAAGIMTYYAFWEPGFRSQYSDFIIDPLFLYGPMLQVTFLDRWSLSGLLLTNDPPGTNIQYTLRDTGSAGPYAVKTKTKVSRTDMDLALTYAAHPRLKLFAGMKHFTFDIRGSGSDISITEGNYTFFNNSKTQDSGGDMKNQSTGGAAGLGYNYPLSVNINLAVNASFLYTTTNILYFRYTDAGGILNSSTRDYNYRGTGCNTTAQISYYLSGFSTSVSLGGRFQVTTYKPVGDAPSLATDYFYGVTLSALYLF